MIDLQDTDKKRYFSISKFNNRIFVFLFESLSDS